MSRHHFIFYVFCFAILNLPMSVSSAKGPITGKTYAIDVVSSLAFLGVGQHLVIFDVTNPRSSLQISKGEALGDSIQDIQVIGNLAFIAAGSSGLQIIDVSNPYQPIKTSSFETPGQVYGIYVVDGYAYLAAGGAGLLLMDVSDPSSPTPVAFSKTAGWDRDVVVSGGYAYVASGEDGVRVVDISDPAHPLNVGSISSPNDANDIYIDGDLLFIAAGSGGLQIVNISDPRDPKEVVIEDTGYARRVRVDSGYAYVATERKGVWAIDISNLSTPKRVKRFIPQGSANSLDIEGDYIYVADGVGGLLVINLSKGRTQELRRDFSPALQAGSKP